MKKSIKHLGSGMHFELGLISPAEEYCIQNDD